MNNTTDNMDMLKNLGTQSVESMRALSELNFSTWEKLAKQQADTLGLLFETSVKQINASIDLSDPKEILSNQAAAGKDLSETLMTKGKEAQQFASETGNAYRLWFESAFAQFTPKGNETP